MQFISLVFAIFDELKVYFPLFEENFVVSFDKNM
jgi:hypothetical protein